MEQPYQSPEAELVQRNPIQPRRTAPTVWGILFMVLAVLGLLAALLGFVAAISDNADAFDLSQPVLVLDSTLSIIGKIFLFLFALALIIRARWVVMVGYVGLSFSVVDSVFKGIVVIPAQANAAMSQAHALGTYVGFFFLAAVSLAMYLGVLLYLRGDVLRQEFNLK